jgi:Holliday junction resolvase RusA-like endonuclease
LVVGEPSSSAVQFVVEGEPYPQPRARFISGRVKRLYDPSQGKKQALKNQLLVALQEVPVFHRGVPLIAEFRFEMSRPAYHFRSDGTIKPGIPSHCMVPPDIDNLCKYILDVMKGVIFEDDAQVVSLQAEMPYCHSTGCNSDPRTCVKISAKAD